MKLNVKICRRAMNISVSVRSYAWATIVCYVSAVWQGCGFTIISYARLYAAMVAHHRKRKCARDDARAHWKCVSPTQVECRGCILWNMHCARWLNRSFYRVPSKEADKSVARNFCLGGPKTFIIYKITCQLIQQILQVCINLTNP